MATTDADIANGERILQCGRCAKVNLGAAWVGEEKAVRELRTFDRPELPRFPSAVCPHCLAHRGVRPGAGHKGSETAS
jgi:hypothetical protein